MFRKPSAPGPSLKGCRCEARITQTKEAGMLIRTTLHRVQSFVSFVYYLSGDC
mgnify:CR=1 FL=1